MYEMCACSVCRQLLIVLYRFETHVCVFSSLIRLCIMKMGGGWGGEKGGGHKSRGKGRGERERGRLFEYTDKYTKIDR